MSDPTVVLGFILVFVLLVCVLVSVAFFTLMERSVLGYVQVRKGPNKVGLVGVFQPFADAVKLFTKEQCYPMYSNLLGYYAVVVLSLFLMMIMWVVYPWYWGSWGVEFPLVYILCISSLGVYVVLGGGWASNSKYSLLGAYRGVAQTISYEVSFALLLISIAVMGGGYSLVGVTDGQDLWFIWGMLILFYIWIVSILAETNRSPFDFAEGESELVSGFNIEYGGGGFAILFMAEYGMMIFMSLLSSIMFMGGGSLLMLKTVFIMLIFLWVRGTYVRFRYDNMMMLLWSKFLPYCIMVVAGVVMFSGIVLHLCPKISK